MSVYMTTATGDRTSGSTLKVFSDVRSPVTVVIYTDTHTYKQKVLLYSKFMFNSKATVNGNRHVREYLNQSVKRPAKLLPDVAVAVRSCLTIKHKFTV